MFPTVADVMTYIKGLKFKNKIGVAFGSYGWNGSGIDMLEEEMKKIGMELIEPALKVRYVPKDEDLKRCVEVGKSVAIALKERSGGNRA
jgi:flavorubredoxin